MNELFLRHQESGQASKGHLARGLCHAHRAVREMKADGLLLEDMKARSSKYLSNRIDRDHRHIKSRSHVVLLQVFQVRRDPARWH
jgi:hypothetical protein